MLYKCAGLDQIVFLCVISLLSTLRCIWQQIENAVSSYFTSKQILYFSFAEQPADVFELLQIQTVLH